VENSEQIMPNTKPAEKGAVITNPQPSLIIFSRGYYSEVFVRGEKPRAEVAPAKDPQNLTDEEKIARYEQWRQFAANAGTYQIKGSTDQAFAGCKKRQPNDQRNRAHSGVQIRRPRHALAKPNRG
jgi:hypothetical protein